jgi:hypothetical protein
MKKVFSISCRHIVIVLILSGSVSFIPEATKRKVFDVHLHGSKSSTEQLKALRSEGVYKACISTSWSLQETYRETKDIELTFGLMLPCPNGKVPYSLQNCYEDGSEYPSIDWVEKQVQQGKIDYFGEILSQYYGVSSSDSSLFPYYRIALKYNLPVGIHTGSAGPNHGSPNFSEAMGNPELLRQMLTQFPRLKVWIMHGGVPYIRETIQIMKDFPNVYADLSAINFPPILPEKQFEAIVNDLIDAGLEDRLMFGSDNNDISTVIRSIERITFLSAKQKEKIFFSNAETFFAKRRLELKK